MESTSGFESNRASPTERSKRAGYTTLPADGISFDHHLAFEKRVCDKLLKKIENETKKQQPQQNE
jgi:hypothetical protein